MDKCRDSNECTPSLLIEEFFVKPHVDWKRPNPNYTLFAQVSCSQSEETLAWKNSLGLAISCIGAFMVIGF